MNKKGERKQLHVLLVIAAALVIAATLNASFTFSLTYNTTNSTLNNLTWWGNNIKMQIRKCSLADCSDGVFIGEDNTSSSYFENPNYNDMLKTNLTNARFIQYKALLETNDSSFTPRLWQANITYYNPSSVDKPAITPSTAYEFQALNCSTKAYHPLSKINITFEWYNASVKYSGQNITTTSGAEASASLTKGIQNAGETWNCTVTSFYGAEFSTPESATKYISSTPAGYWVTTADTLINTTWFGNNIKMQIRTCSQPDCSDNTPFFGSDNTSSSYFINPSFNNLSKTNITNQLEHRYIQYKAYLESGNNFDTPKLWQINIIISISEFERPDGVINCSLNPILLANVTRNISIHMRGSGTVTIPSPLVYIAPQFFVDSSSGCKLFVGTGGVLFAT